MASTNRARPGSSPSMKRLRVAPQRTISSTWVTVARSVSRVVGQRNSGRAVGPQVGRRLAVGHDHDDRLGVGVTPQVAPGEHERVLEVGALHPLRLRLGQLHRRQPARGQVEADDLQRVLAEPGLHEVRQRQRRLLHRAPAALVDHRERQVHEQRDGRGGALLGLHDLEVLDQQPAPLPERPAPPYGVGDGADRVQRQVVAELPRAGSARSARRPSRCAGRRGRRTRRPGSGRRPSSARSPPAAGPPAA